MGRDDFVHRRGNHILTCIGEIRQPRQKPHHRTCHRCRADGIGRGDDYPELLGCVKRKSSAHAELFVFYKAVLFTFGELYGIITLGSYLLDKLEFVGVRYGECQTSDHR